MVGVMQTNDIVRDWKLRLWRVVVMFSDGNVMIERIRARLPTEPPEVVGALVTEIKPR